MQSPPPPPPQEMEAPSLPLPFSDDPLWNWSDILDFSADDPTSSFSFEPLNDTVFPSSDHQIPQQKEELRSPVDPIPDSNSDRVRKRDPRMACSNFLAGRVPCACPEIDEKLAEEEEEKSGAPWKKKAKRSSGNNEGKIVKCQVPDCEADISGLKGYHRRHRVCLNCAHAKEVLIDGERKRYCQQCGKFHILADFDEGKRSCRRKLERHNNRRRRRPIDSKGSTGHSHGDALSEDVACDYEAGKESLGLGNGIVEKDLVLESEDKHASTICSALESQNIRSDSVVSFAATHETQIDGGNNSRKKSLSPSYCDSRSSYSSVCPTGRISFKLYKWNPDEFPIRLRKQIYSWLASMPEELEGYIRPGCTILTVFLTMPKSMWKKLLEDPVTYIHDFVYTPGGMLLGRGNILVNLNNMLFRVMGDGSSIMKVKVEARAPRLHYVHPVCFEAGKPMEFIACGSDLQQRKFRFLVSFAGRYLLNDCCVVSPTAYSGGVAVCSRNHQLHKIYICQTQPNYFGPAFVEVENESGLSNFVPVLIGDKDICSEVNLLHQKFNASVLLDNNSHSVAGDSSVLCEASSSRQMAFSEFLLDVAWLLKEPASESFHSVTSSSQIQRFNYILDFLMRNKSTTILKRILQKLESLMDNLDRQTDDIRDIDIRQLRKYMNYARGTLHEGVLVLQIRDTLPHEENASQCCLQDDKLSFVPISNQDVRKSDSVLGPQVCSTSYTRSETIPLLNRELPINQNRINGYPRKSCGRIFSGSILAMRPAILFVTIAAVCFGVCVVVLHPQKVGKFAVSINRRLFG